MPEANPATVPRPSRKISALRLIVDYSFGSAKRPEASPERPGLDQLGQDPALPFIQRLVHLTEAVERVLAHAINHHVVTLEHAFDGSTVQVLVANRVRDVSA